MSSKLWRRREELGWLAPQAQEGVASGPTVVSAWSQGHPQPGAQRPVREARPRPEGSGGEGPPRELSGSPGCLPSGRKGLAVGRRAFRPDRRARCRAGRAELQLRTPTPCTGPEPRWVSVRTAAILQSGAFSTHVIAGTWSSTQLAADTQVDAKR